MTVYQKSPTLAELSGWVKETTPTVMAVPQDTWQCN